MMTINPTLNYELARRSEALINFSAQVTTAATYMNNPGGQAGDGMPLPKAARIYRIDVWDGAALNSDSGNVSASQGDRISVYVTPNGGSFDVSVRINGIDTALVAGSVAQNATLMATVHLQLLP